MQKPTNSRVEVFYSAFTSSLNKFEQTNWTIKGKQETAMGDDSGYGYGKEDDDNEA